MSKKVKEIIKRDIPRLRWGQVTDQNEINFNKNKWMRQRRVYVTYIFTVGTIFILSGILIFTMLFYKGGIKGEISDLISDLCFPNLSLSQIKDSIPIIDIFNITEGILTPTDSPLRPPSDEDTDIETDGTEKIDKEGLYDFDYGAVPEGETPIIPMDLSLSSYGVGYIHNSTGLAPDTEKLLSATLGYSGLEYLSSSTSPTVLIIHTHGTESYSANGAISYRDDGGELARSDDIRQNVVAVGKRLSETLRKKGIYSVHCEIMHDAGGYRDAYARAEDTIKLYLERYPTIKLVVDIHRDSVVKSSGELVRPVTVVDDKAAAQIMCVVGSNWGGESNDRWEANLALALQIRKKLNEKYTDICRPVYLKASTYNQEFAPYSLLLEIGSSGNSIEEAFVACDAAADAIYSVIVKK